MENMMVGETTGGLYVASVSHPLHTLICGYGLSESEAKEDLAKALAALEASSLKAPGASKLTL
jgi:hypothetical protein